MALLENSHIAIPAHRMRAPRRGIAAVEAAILFPLVIALTFGAIEYGWVFLKQQQITNAVRQGARIAATPDATTASVTSTINSLMTAAGMGSSGYTVTFNPADITTVAPGQTFTVKVAVTYANVSLFKNISANLMPVPANLGQTITMAKEGP